MAYILIETRDNKENKMSQHNNDLNTLYDELKELRNRAWAQDYTALDCGEAAQDLMKMIDDMKMARIDAMLKKTNKDCK